MEPIHPFLKPAVSAAVVETKGAPTAPTTDELQKLLAQHAALINQQSTVIQQQQATITALQGAIPDQIANALTSYNATIVAPLVQQVGLTTTGLATLTTAVGTKASATDLAALVTTVGTKAPNADLSALQGIVSTHTSDIAANVTVLATKALATDVTALATVVGTKATQADLTSLSTTVAGKATSTTVAALAGVVDTKASATDLSSLATTVAGKALASDLIATNNTVAANTTAINLRATTASVTALQTAVTQNTTDIAARATTAALAVQTGRVDGLLNTTVPALQADTAQRLLRAGDTSTGPQMQPVATLGGAAPRFDQTFGGLNSPVRGAYNLGTTAVALGPGPLTDPTPQGRKAQVIQVFIAMRTAPVLGVSTTIKVGTTPGGSDIYTKTYALSALPALNNLLQAVPTSIAELPAGTVLYAQAVNNLGTDGGKWDAIVQSYYKS